MTKKPIKSKFIKVNQPLGDFYIGKMRFEDLFNIAFADVRRIEQDEQTGYESYFGIQRKLSKNRVKEISEYVTTLDATFPSSILLAIDEYSIELEDFEVSNLPNISFNEDENTLTIKRKSNIAHIIDGQHRVFGLKKAIDDNGMFAQRLKDFEVVVTIFVNMDDENQALIFSTINKAHTKVNKSLVYDLFDLAKTRSPQRVVHNIVKLLNEKEGSPFEDRIKMLGFAQDNSKEILTQATLAELILNYISKNPMLDRDYLKRGKNLKKFEGKDYERYFFRDWFIEKNEAKIAKVIWNYFKAVEKKYPNAWGNSDFILTKSTGIIALMRFLKDIVLYIGFNKLISIEEFEEILNRIEIKEGTLTNDVYIAGGVGQSRLYKGFMKYFINNVNVCDKEHRFDERFESLPESQKFYMQGRRHQCSGCAYDQGYKDAISGKASNFRVEELDVTQAGIVRHKDPLKGYEMGYEDGLKKRNNK